MAVTRKAAPSEDVAAPVLVRTAWSGQQPHRMCVAIPHCRRCRCSRRPGSAGTRLLGSFKTLTRIMCVRASMILYPVPVPREIPREIPREMASPHVQVGGKGGAPGRTGCKGVARASAAFTRRRPGPLVSMPLLQEGWMPYIGSGGKGGKGDGDGGRAARGRDGMLPLFFFLGGGTGEATVADAHREVGAGCLPCRTAWPWAP